MTNTNTKALLSFTDYSDAKLATFATKVDNSLTGNANFPLAQPLMLDLSTAIVDYNKKLAEAQGGSRVQIEIKNLAKAALTDLLREACRAVNYDANSDRLKLLTSGFDITSETKKAAAPAPVLQLKAA